MIKWPPSSCSLDHPDLHVATTRSYSSSSSVSSDEEERGSDSELRSSSRNDSYSDGGSTTPETTPCHLHKKDDNILSRQRIDFTAAIVAMILLGTALLAFGMTFAILSSRPVGVEPSPTTDPPALGGTDPAYIMSTQPPASSLRSSPPGEWTTSNDDRGENSSPSSDYSVPSCARVSPPPLPGKKGIGYTLRPEGQKGSWVENLPKLIALKPHWNYSWGLSRIQDQPDDIEFVPMVWGKVWGRQPRETLMQRLSQVVANGKVKRIAAFNEPDRIEQSNMKVDEAKALWPILENAGIPLISPSCANPSGPWMDEFMADADDANCEYVNRRVDWVGVHYYGSTTNPEAFKKKMREHYERYDRRPLIITEFAVADWDAVNLHDNRFSRREVLDFMKDVLPWVSSHAMYRYMMAQQNF